MTDLDTLSVNTIRGLCMDAIQKANSGHPVIPMGMAPVAYTLWQRLLAAQITQELTSDADREFTHDSSTSALVRRYRALKR
ncbi:ribulose phosphate epimerase [Streptomyces sp. NPDC005181]|uniref:ribulose phosphate epimerase n=1 Tax=Streptomyces sp. NPDC005181 TaxID=3156869 RepID=UPI0033A6D957